MGHIQILKIKGAGAAQEDDPADDHGDHIGKQIHHSTCEIMAEETLCSRHGKCVHHVHVMLFPKLTEYGDACNDTHDDCHAENDAADDGVQFQSLKNEIMIFFIERFLPEFSHGGTHDDGNTQCLQDADDDHDLAVVFDGAAQIARRHAFKQRPCCHSQAPPVRR